MSDEALRHIADLLNTSDRGRPEAEAFLKQRGWDWCERWRSPEELAALPTCVNCGEKFDPDGWRTNYCIAHAEGDTTDHVPENQ